MAQRLAAAPGTKTYGALSVGVQVLAQVERLFRVRPGSFRPAPKVDSAVVRITPRLDPLVAEAEQAGFRGFVNAVFAQRRKQMVRILRTVMGYGREEAESVLDGLGIGLSVRPETLAPCEFVRLFRATSR